MQHGSSPVVGAPVQRFASADRGMWGSPHVGADAGGRGICLWQGGARRALGVHTRCSTVPLRWSEHLYNGSPARIDACGDHHTLMLMQGGEVFACGSNINAEGQLRIGTRNSAWYPTGLESRRDRFRRWQRGGGTRQRRACPGVTRRDASSCCCLAHRRAGKDTVMPAGVRARTL